MNKTKIEWADYSWNPVVGCTPVSVGCQNCYAKAMHERFNKTRFSFVTVHSERLEEPMKLKKPSNIFVCSMSDLFHEDVPGAFIHEVMKVAKYNERHKFLFLTKRPERMRRICMNIDGIKPDNAWLGVSVENQKTADERISILLNTPAQHRFVSVEPMLGGLCLSQTYMDKHRYFETGTLDWVICGCESGANRRPCSFSWMLSLKNQCTVAGVPFFLKQMEVCGRVQKMPRLDGRVWDEMPEELKRLDK